MNCKPVRRLVVKQFASSVEDASEIVETKISPPLADQVLIRNRYVGINPIFDREVARNRVALRQTVLGQTLGVEAVGEVIAVGANVKNIKEGDAVSTVIAGTAYQTHQTSCSHQVVKIPAASAEYLALIPTGVSGLVALQQVAELRSDETCILSAAAGGLGHIVLQLIKRSNNHLIAVCGSVEKAALCQELGADRVINYTTESIDEVLTDEYPNGVNLAYDSVGQEVFDTFADHLAIRGRLLVSGYAADFALETPAEVLQSRIYTKLYWKAASIRAFMNPVFVEFQEAAREEIIDLYQSGSLRVVIDKHRFQGIESIVEASNYLLDGLSCGKVVVEL